MAISTATQPFSPLPLYDQSGLLLQLMYEPVINLSHGNTFIQNALLQFGAQFPQLRLSGFHGFLR